MDLLLGLRLIIRRLVLFALQMLDTAHNGSTSNHSRTKHKLRIDHHYKRWPDRWTKYSYDYLSDSFIETLPLLGINPEHRGHDGRVHFVTLAKKAEMDEYALKRIVGHKIDDLTERVYTRRTVEWLISELDKIP